MCFASRPSGTSFRPATLFSTTTTESRSWKLTSTYEHSAGYAGGVAEYGSNHDTPEQGDRLARVRSEERDGQCRFFRGESDRAELTAGASVQLVGHPRLDDPSLLLVEVEHRGSQVVGTHGGDGSEGYLNAFKAVDASRTYRPPRVTPRPRIHGVLTAITEPAAKGTSGRIAQIDEQGRYTVRFFFDAASGEGRVRSSAPVRMVQPHAGANYGMHFPLKPGIEVAVTFVDGDPDRPIIAGAVPNPLNRVAGYRKGCRHEPDQEPSRGFWLSSRTDDGRWAAEGALGVRGAGSLRAHFFPNLP